jgi:uncharacterized protein (TIGR02118 family)
MKSKLILASLLLTFYFSGFSQEKRSRKPTRHTSSVTEKGLIKVAVLYPYSEGKTFNMEYYENNHMPMVAKFLGTNLVKYTIEKVTASGIPNEPLPYMAIGTFYVKSLQDYQAAITPNIAAIRADFANYTNALPVIIISEVIR